MADATGRDDDATLPQQFLDFMNESWTAFHAVATARKMLLAAGFTELSERDPWTKDRIAPGGRYFFTRNGSALVACAVGAKFEPGNGVIAVGAHTDSPCLKLKPTSKLTKHGMLQLGVQTYGGGLWGTWFDRDLGVAGRALVRRRGEGGAPDEFEHKLVKVAKPICRVPTLAVHMARGSGTKIEINPETHLPPVLATAIKEQLMAGGGGDDGSNGGFVKVDGGGAGGGAGAGAGAGEKKKADPAPGTSAANHHAALLRVLAEELGCAPGDVEDFELQMCDVQPSAIGGVHGEFIYSGRLDNLTHVFCAARFLRRKKTHQIPYIYAHVLHESPPHTHTHARAHSPLR